MGASYIVYNDGQAKTPFGSELSVSKKSGMSPKIYFSYIKKKFGVLERARMERRMKKLQHLVDDAIGSGQEALSEEFFKKLIKEVRESEMYSKGYKIFIEDEFLEKFRHKVRGQAVSLTPLKNYIRNIPNDVKEKIKVASASKLFDEIVIVHYDPDKEASKLTEKEEREDPIAFGTIVESNRYYFIADWEDKYCDLTLDDIIDKLSLEDDQIKLGKNPAQISSNVNKK